MILKGWRFNLRKSNTESLLRLNVESMGNKSLLNAKVAEIFNCFQVPICLRIIGYVTAKLKTERL